MLVVLCSQEQVLLTKDSLSQNMEAIKRKYEVYMFRLLKISCGSI